jgi:hypothetical protein
LQRFAELIPEIRAQERLDEAMIALLPHMKDRPRKDLLRAWRQAAGYEPPVSPSGGHDRAWDSLRSLVRR